MAGLALVALALAAHWPALDAGFVWDDDDYVTENPTLGSLAGLGRIWFQPGAVPQYYPLTFTSLWLDHALFGLAPAGYHATNLLLHAITAVLAWRVLRRLAVPGAWLAAALFAVHPVHVESVAWVAERKNVLSGALGMAAALCWLRWSDAEPGRARGWWVAAVAAFVGGLLAKTVVCTVPVVLLLADWWRRGRLERRTVLGLAPLVALGAAIAPVTVWMERTHVGAVGAAWDLSLVDRILIAARALWHQLASVVWPRGLAFVYARWPVDPSALWQWAFPLAAAGVAVALWAFRTRIGWGPLLAAVAFAITLGPSLGFVDVYPMRYTFVADHYQYLASLAPLALLGALAVHAGRPGVVAAAVAVVVLGGLAWSRAHAFRDAETLWRDTLATQPDVEMARINLGMLLYRAGRPAEAAATLEEALRREPDDADALNNLALALMALGRGDEALARWQRAVAVAPGNAEAQVNLGNALAQAGRLDDAEARYRAALAVRPAYADAWANLGNVRLLRGDPAGAQEAFARAVGLDPGFAAARRGLGLALTAQGDALLGQERLGEAIEAYRAALRQGAATAGLQNNLGVALARTGRTAEARTAFEAALALNPDDPDARANLSALR